MSNADQVLRAVHHAAVKAATDRLLAVLNSEFPVPSVAVDALLSSLLCIADGEKRHEHVARALELAAADLRAIAAGHTPAHVERTGDAVVAQRIH